MPSFPEGATDVLDAEGVTRAVALLGSAQEIAVDVEADAMHHFHARLCFVQVGTDAQVLLFDTLQPGVQAKALADLFADPGRTKIFHAAGGDLQYLAEQGVRVKGLFDTHRAATLLGWLKVGLADLAREKLGIELAKEHQQSDFSIRPLPPGMREYIANDVRYLVELGRIVRAACVEADILEEVLLDCERLCDEAAARPETIPLAIKLPKGLPPPKLALAYALANALHVLRLEWAEKADVPMGRMLSNAALWAIVERLPKDVRELAKLEGVRGPFAREHGEELLALIRDLQARAEKGELPPPPGAIGVRDPGRRKRDEQLKIFRAQKAKERKVTGSVVLSNALVDELSARPPASLEALGQVPYFGEKRVRLYGRELLKLLGAT